MWLMTTRGFYSAVEKRGDAPDHLTIRARNRADLENLTKGDLAGLIPNAQIVGDAGTDYTWRIRVKKSEWASVCAALALEVEYGNFKDEIKKVRGWRVASVYGRLWSVLLGLEDRPPRGRFAATMSLDDEIAALPAPTLPAPTRKAKRRKRLP